MVQLTTHDEYKDKTNLWVVRVVWVPGDITRITQTNFG